MDKSRQLTSLLVLTASRLEGIANKYVYFPMQMTSSSAKILRLLSHNGGMNSMQIMELTGSTKSNISQRLNFLEKNMLIKRTGNKKDRRKVLIEITAKGQDKIKEADDRLQASHKLVAKKFDRSEIDNCLAFLSKLNLAIDAERVNLAKSFILK